LTRQWQLSQTPLAVAASLSLNHSPLLLLLLLLLHLQSPLVGAAALLQLTQLAQQLCQLGT
jgi:hypothetical protein